LKTNGRNPCRDGYQEINDDFLGTQLPGKGRQVSDGPKVEKTSSDGQNNEEAKELGMFAFKLHLFVPLSIEVG